jgi:integrase
MPRISNILDANTIDTAIAKGESAKLRDGGSLYLWLRGGSALWLYHYREGQAMRTRSLGSYPDMTPNAARRARNQFAATRERLPIERRGLAVRATSEPARVPEKAATKRQRFAEVLESYLALNAPQWKGDKQERRYRLLLKTKLGAMWVDEITTADVETTLKPMTLATADKNRMMIKLVLDYASAKDFRDRSIPNPAAVEIMRHLIPAPRKAKSHEAMPSEKVPALFAELVADGSPAARALAFLILTAARTAEARDADWSEIRGNVWIIPGERMKEGVEHRVPLTKPALALLGKPQKSGRIFGKLGHRALDNKFKANGGNGYTTHGFRATFSGDWAAKEGYSLELRDRALAHKVGNDVSGRYNRDTLLEQRRRMMTAWSRFCTS